MLRSPVGIVVSLVLAGSVYAADTAEKPNTPPPPPPGMMGHRGPPPEAIDACKGKKTDDACEFTPPARPKDAPKEKGEAKGERKITGKCWAPETSKPLACRPAGGHPPLPEKKD